MAFEENISSNSTSIQVEMLSYTLRDGFRRKHRRLIFRSKLSAWLPMLSQYGPDLLVQCETALNLSKELVRTWLETYMFKDSPDSLKKASAISDWLANHKNFKSHSRHISRTDLLKHQLKVIELEKDHILQDLSLSIFHATTHTFTGTPAVKIVENHTGRAFIKQHIPPPPPQTVQVDLGIDPNQPV